ncbi:hypothetical protein LOK49_LG09G01296 [Camellia lanceoleosa]|uniref:Uncharacterized protein n=1 Tax=Camellia lanceoleosa TaxID=1840588 RepID=A0ACC0GIY4_9ERIC|nr:hypothetical protein LOK49_LG09G01296 [Camellia lanceoleosa]
MRKCGLHRHLRQYKRPSIAYEDSTRQMMGNSNRYTATYTRQMMENSSRYTEQTRLPAVYTTSKLSRPNFYQQSSLQPKQSILLLSAQKSCIRPLGIPNTELHMMLNRHKINNR